MGRFLGWSFLIYGRLIAALSTARRAALWDLLDDLNR